MSFAAFLIQAVIISLSGVMAPGPITTVVVGKGSESPHAGAWVAVGHGIVEFPLMVAVFFGVGALLDAPYVQSIIALAGGLFLLWMSQSMIRTARQSAIVGKNQAHSPVTAGILLSLGNPYFIVWWATVVAALILQSVEFGVLGFLAFATTHWLCDLAWDYLLSAMVFKGGQFFGRGFQRGIFLVCGGLLLIFGGKLLLDGAALIFA